MNKFVSDSEEGITFHKQNPELEKQAKSLFAKLGMKVTDLTVQPSHRPEGRGFKPELVLR